MLTVVFLCPKAGADSEHVKFVNKLQNEFGRPQKNLQIIYIDREIIGVNKTSPDQTLAQTEAIKKFVATITGEPLNAELAKDISIRLDIGTAMVLPAEDTKTKMRYCFVLTDGAKATASERSKAILYWDLMKEKPEYKGLEIARSLTEQQLKKLTYIHETFHCLDPYYYVKNYTGQYNSEELAHRAESFAEAAALLYLAAYGEKQLGETRALYRIAGSYMQGRYPETFGPNINDVSYSFIYSIHPSILAAQIKIETGKIPRNLNQIIAMAHQIVEKKAFDGLGYVAITNYQADPAAFRARLEASRFEGSPEYQERMANLGLIVKEYEEKIRWAFAVLFKKSDK